MTRRLVPAVAGAAGVMLLAAGAVTLMERPAQHSNVPSPKVDATPVAIVEKLPQPANIPVPVNAAGTPAARIKIPDLAVDLEVVPGDGVNAPLYKAAEYPEPMKLPGQGGRSMIYAHARTGMFGPLFNARVGQKVEVDLADGRRLSYTIREYYAHWPVTDLRWFQQSDHEQLVLVTCTTYDPNDPRIVVVADPA